METSSLTCITCLANGDEFTIATTERSQQTMDDHMASKHGPE